MVCVRGVYNAALATRQVDWTRKHDHYVGPLTREALLAAVDDKQQRLLTTLKTVDIDAPIDWDGTPFTFALFMWELVQHEAIYHGVWSVYASLAGFDTPLSWRASWGFCDSRGSFDPGLSLPIIHTLSSTRRGLASAD